MQHKNKVLTHGERRAKKITIKIVKKFGPKTYRKREKLLLGIKYSVVTKFKLYKKYMYIIKLFIKITIGNTHTFIEFRFG